MSSLGAVAALVLALSGAAAWRPGLPKGVRKPEGEIFLRAEEEVRTLPGHAPSHRYGLPDDHLWDGHSTNVRLFGVRSCGEVALTLFSPATGLGPLRLALSRGRCTAAYLDERRSRPCEPALDASRMAWFVLEVSPTYVAVRAVGEEEPAVDFAVDDLGGGGALLNFNEYSSYTLSSSEGALWDVQGHRLDEAPETADPFVVRGLAGTEEALRKIREHQWRCEEATARKKAASDPATKRKYKEFKRRFCNSNSLDHHFTSAVRLEATLKANGVAVPSREDYDVEAFFKKRFG